MAGAVIQATGRTELEDGLCAGGQLKARNGLQRVCTILWNVRYSLTDQVASRLYCLKASNSFFTAAYKVRDVQK